MAKKSVIDMSEMKIPNHVAIILDGNGRWAKKRLMPRNYGHAKGAKTVEKICEEAWDMGIKYLTVYAFSTENWKRPQDEVDALMKLLKNYLKDCIERSNSNDMRVRVIGDKTVLNDEIREKIEELEEMTKDNKGLNFTIAINYGSRDEMVRAMKKMAMDVKEGKVSPEELSEATFENYLDTIGIPDPDLLIRTSGEQRLSNYLLWQLAYTEFYFTDVLWPDFSKKDLEQAVLAYNKRDRRFGKVST
ncbi:MAG: isoprenyl transferase [Lachnospiraceae bacterium]|nr:isoprenyl transferase [Lachnospiraceae bacterium]MEE0862157.1 isoprenyl transferase [Lachnospiraceae bacterium]